ncbi:uncharacterized protein LOC142520224 [Primulina tabacum]|uniref:uncharacterized protein LOC142520224 n=1 Tax=Primulina tabacum TaxID=48773 RepID=UPI003F59EACB
MEHIARFTIKCGELVNLENLNNLKFWLFPKSLTGTAFAWYASLPRNLVMSWQEMERQFHIQFYIIELEVCISDLSRVTQKKGESVISFIERFKRMKNRFKVFLPETEFVKMAKKGLDFELRKKFQGLDFRDFFDLAAKVAQYEELFREESYKKRTAMVSYYQEVEDVVFAEIQSAGSCTVPLIKKKSAEPEKQNNSQLPQDMQYTIDVSKTEEVFDFLVKGKFITFLHDHRMPPKEEQKFREYYRINNGIVKFPNKQEFMVVDDDPLPPVALVNVNVTDLRDLLNYKKADPLP